MSCTGNMPFSSPIYVCRHGACGVVRSTKVMFLRYIYEIRHERAMMR